MMMAFRSCWCLEFLVVIELETLLEMSITRDGDGGVFWTLLFVQAFEEKNKIVTHDGWHRRSQDC